MQRRFQPTTHHQPHRTLHLSYMHIPRFDIVQLRTMQRSVLSTSFQECTSTIQPGIRDQKLLATRHPRVSAPPRTHVPPVCTHVLLKNLRCVTPASKFYSARRCLLPSVAQASSPAPNARSAPAHRGCPPRFNSTPPAHSRGGASRPRHFFCRTAHGSTDPSHSRKPQKAPAHNPVPTCGPARVLLEESRSQLGSLQRMRSNNPTAHAESIRRG